MVPYKSFFLNLSYTSAYSACIPLIVGFIFKKRLKPNFTVLLYLVFVGLFTEITAIFYHKYFYYNNLVVSRFFTVAEFVILSIFFIKTLSPSKTALFIKVFIFVFLGVTLLDLYVHGIEAPDNFASSTESILLMVYSLFTFFYIMQNPVYANILSDPLFWFNTAILVYFSGTFFFFIFNGYIVSNNIHLGIFAINAVLNIIFNLLLATGFWKTKHSQIS